MQEISKAPVIYYLPAIIGSDGEYVVALYGYTIMVWLIPGTELEA